MRWSIAGIMNFNMFGIPMVGADVCGFFSKSNDTDVESEICGRWMQLATFYPFARQHRDASGGGEPNEPYNLKSPWKEMAVSSIKERYKYLRFVYTCQFEASINGGTCFDPLLFHFPDLNGTEVYEDMEHTFLVGDAVKVSPVLNFTGDDKTFKSFFPKGKWLSLTDMSVMDVQENGMVELDIPATVVQHHLRAGYMVPVQETQRNNTQALLSDPISLYALRDEQKHA